MLEDVITWSLLVLREGLERTVNPNHPRLIQFI